MNVEAKRGQVANPWLTLGGIIAALALMLGFSFIVVTDGLSGVTGRNVKTEPTNWNLGGVDAIFVESMLYRDKQLRRIATSGTKQASKPRVYNFSKEMLATLDTWDASLHQFASQHSIASNKLNHNGYALQKSWSTLANQLSQPALTNFDRQFVAGMNIVSHSTFSQMQQNVGMLVDPELKKLANEILKANAAYGPSLSGWATASK